MSAGHHYDGHVQLHCIQPLAHRLIRKCIRTLSQGWVTSGTMAQFHPPETHAALSQRGLQDDSNRLQEALEEAGMGAQGHNVY